MLEYGCCAWFTPWPLVRRRTNIILYPSPIPRTYFQPKDMSACCTSSVFSFRLMHSDMSVIIFITQVWMRRVLPNHSSHFLLHILSDVLLLQIFKWIILFEVRNDLSSSSCSEFTALQSPWVLATVSRRAHLLKLFTYLYSTGFCYRDSVAIILRPRKEVPWFVGMTALEASHCPPIAVFPSNPRWPMSTDQSFCC